MRVASGASTSPVGERGVRGTAGGREAEEMGEAEGDRREVDLVMATG
jgi:hypothetical protein